MGTVRFTQMKDGGVEDYQSLDRHEREFAAGTADRVMAALAELGGWPPGSGIRVGPVRAAYAEWLATTMPTLFPGTSAGELVGRLTRAGTEEETRAGTEEETMAVTVLEERLQRQRRRVRRDGEALGMERGEALGMERGLAGSRDLLRGLAARKFGPGTGARVAGLLAGIGGLNYPLTHLGGSAKNLRLVERFRRVDAETLDYRYTIDDATTFVQPWTVRMPMRPAEGMYEYACHEGNYGLMNILRGRRVQEGTDR